LHLDPGCNNEVVSRRVVKKQQMRWNSLSAVILRDNPFNG